MIHSWASIKIQSFKYFSTVLLICICSQSYAKNICESIFQNSVVQAQISANLKTKLTKQINSTELLKFLSSTYGLHYFYFQKYSSINEMRVSNFKYRNKVLKRFHEQKKFYNLNKFKKSLQTNFKINVEDYLQIIFALNGLNGVRYRDLNSNHKSIFRHNYEIIKPVLEDVFKSRDKLSVLSEVLIKDSSILDYLNNNIKLEEATRNISENSIRSDLNLRDYFSILKIVYIIENSADPYSITKYKKFYRDEGGELRVNNQKILILEDRLFN